MQRLTDIVFALTAILVGISLFSLLLVSVGWAADTCPTDADGYCIELREPINGVTTIQAEDGVSLLSNYIGLIYRYAASIIGIICVLVIVLSGVQIIFSGFDPSIANEAKARILQAILSLLLLFGSGLLLKTINPGFFIV